MIKFRHALLVLLAALSVLVGLLASPAAAQTADYIRNSPNSTANLYVNTGVTLTPGKFVQARQFYLPGGQCAMVSLYRDGVYTGENYGPLSKGWHYGYSNMTTQVRRFTC